jgi:hypothetical protein
LFTLLFTFSLTPTKLFVFVLLDLFQLSASSKVIDFKYRIDGYAVGDDFGWSMDSHTNRLVIGAYHDNNNRGSVKVDQGVKVNGPDKRKVLRMGSCSEPQVLGGLWSTSPYTLIHTLRIS